MSATTAESESVSLDMLSPGEKGLITKICGESNTTRKLMEMGLVRGTEIEVVRFAPLGDPIDVRVRGYHLSLRKTEASAVTVRRHESDSA